MINRTEVELHQVVESAPNAFVMADAEGRIVLVNARAENLFGYRREELIGQPVEMLMPEQFRTGHREDRRNYMADPQTRPMGAGRDLWAKRKDGSEVPVEIGLSPIQTDQGTLVLASVVDISERKRADEARARLAAIVESSDDAIVSKDLNGIIQSWNAGAERMFGYSAEEVIGQPISLLLPPERMEEEEQILRCLREGERVEHLETVRAAKDGRRIDVSLTISPMKDHAGRVIGASKIARDITARKRAEEELKAAKVSADRAKAAAELANRTKDHFLAVLSHELRTPLTPVVMGVSVLQKRSDLAPETRETLEMVRRNAEMEARLIDDLLDVTRIERGKIELQKQPVELCTVIQRAVEVCKPDIEARNLHFGVDRGATAPYWIEADVPRLQQVFWNLLKNAIKFTPHGGCVGIRCRPNEKYVVAEVNDSGIGIEPEAMSRVFNAFEQAERSITRRFGGLGLGLAISKALVEMHGGVISAHSNGRNQGATFRVQLPLVAPDGQPEVLAPAPSPQRAVRPLRILLVEDHGVTAKMLSMVLASDGHAVETAGDVATGLELASQHSFDLLISDLGLPDASGHDLMRQLRERGHTFPGIALSGYGQEEDIQRSREAGFAAHLTKPASHEAVVEAVAAVTAREPMSADAPTIGSEPSLQVGSPPPNADSSIFNPEEAIRRCFRREEMFQRMIETFFQDVDRLFPQMRAALQKGDIAQVGHLGHRLKGTIVHLAAQHAEAAALCVEQFVKRPVQPAEAEEAINALERECETLKAILGKWHCATVSQNETGNIR